MKGSKTNLTVKQAITIGKTLAILGVIAILGYSAYFLYENFYQVMTESEEIVKLQKSISNENINMKKFNEIVEALERREKKEDIIGINDPFD